MTSSPESPDAARPAAPVAVVAGHGDLAAGLVSAVGQITGRGDLLLPMSNRGLGPAEIEAALREALASGTVRAVFTDLSGGSCTMAARRVQQLIASGAASGELRDVHAAFVADVVASSMVRIQQRRVVEATGLDDAQAYTELADLVLHGVSA